MLSHICVVDRCELGSASNSLDYGGGELKFRSAVIPSGSATGVEVPGEVMKTLGPEARVAFDRLPFDLKRKHVAEIEDAKKPGCSTTPDWQTR